MGNWHRSSEPLEPSPLLKQSRQGADIAKLLEQSQQRSVVPTHRGQLWRDLLCVDSLKEVEPQDLFQHLLNLPLDDDRVIFAEACIQKDLTAFSHIASDKLGRSTAGRSIQYCSPMRNAAQT
ncbi:unnamed protein product [Cladocopium goreaui]|uniref:Uncharacterized protein n=1 Tax=Cladocopium goreaui TaxID=2562237 RepID=A0A9P1BZ73_9DINO|nr:unnamed protein product [Cladocopium goreaui]